MGLRFRRYIKLAPGVRLNLSGSGISWNFGPRGASIGIGRRGTFLNTGIPGTGLYSRQRIGGSSKRSLVSSSSTSKVSVTVSVTDDGSITFKDSEGNPLPDHLIEAAKKQQGDVIRELIQKKCDEINAQIDAIGEIHLYTPSPDQRPVYQPQEFSDPLPEKPLPEKPGIWGFFSKAKRDQVEKANIDREHSYEEVMERWRTEKKRFYDEELRRKDIIERGIYTSATVMQDFLEENLQEIVWTRETIVSTELLEDGKRIFVDVDLPEIEDLPDKKASMPHRGYKFSVKEMKPTQFQRLYMNHVHGIGFRIIGEIYAALPSAQEVVLSAFSQRPDRATGRISDEYLYSVRTERDTWAQIDFKNLQSLDVVEALARFEIRRDMTKTGKFKAIDPFAPS